MLLASDLDRTRHPYRPTRQRPWLGFACGLLMLATLPAVAQSAAGSEGAHPAVAEAFELLRDGQYRHAVKVCRKAKSLTGESEARCSLAMAIAHSFLGDRQEAVESAQRAINASRDEAVLYRAHLEIGNALAEELKLGQKSTTRKIRKSAREDVHRRAAAAFRQAITLKPNDRDSRLSLADVLMSHMLELNDAEPYDELKELIEPMLEADQLGDLTDWGKAILCRTERYEGLLPAFQRASSAQHASEASEREDQIARANNKRRASAARVSSTQAKVRAANHEVLDPMVFTGAVQRPVVVNSPAPIYTELARKARVQGVVIVQAVIDKQGDIVNIRPLKGLPLCLTEEAMLAMREWKFRPATLEGQPVDVFYNLTVNFRLE